MRFKKLKIVASLLIFCILFVATGKFLRYILTDDTSSYTRIAYHEMYEQENIDVLFVGSSHCYRSLVPEILDKELGKNTFNAGSSSQFLDGSYMLIKEVDRYNDINHIYLELYFGCASDVKENRTSLVSTYIVSDYIRPSFDKYMYLYQSSSSEHYANSFIVARRNWSRLFDFNYIKEIIIKKDSEAYKKYDYSLVSSDTEWYGGKGYVANSGIVKDWNYFSTSGWNSIDMTAISENWKNDLISIIDYCEKKQINLTIFSAPMPNFLLVGVGNYDEYIKCVKDIVKDKDVEYYDFNLCKEEYFPNTSEFFKDVDHVNCYGAERFSYLFADLVNGKVSADEMFYDSYQEKLNSIDETIFGISYYDEIQEEGLLKRKCKIVTNANDDWEYRISVITEEGEEFIVRDYSNDIYFSLDPNIRGACIVEYRDMNDIFNKGTLKLTILE